MVFLLPYATPQPLSPYERLHIAFWAWIAAPSLPTSDWASEWARLSSRSVSPDTRDGLILQAVSAALAALRGDLTQAAQLDQHSGCAPAPRDPCRIGLRNETRFWEWLRMPEILPQPGLHPEWHSIEHDLGLLVEIALKCRHGSTDHLESKLPPHLLELGRAVISLKRGFQAPPSGLAVDLTHGRLKYGETLVVARSLAHLLGCFARREVLGEREILRRVFGLQRFEEEHHRRKLSNLLTEARRLLPESASLHYSDGEVFAMGDWSQIQFWREHPLLIAARALPQPQALPQPSTSDRRHLVDPHHEVVLKSVLRNKETWSRQELQQALGISKSSAIRLLQRLQKERSWIAVGSTHHRRYRPRLPKQETGSR